jgi:hypothetical protein
VSELETEASLAERDLPELIQHLQEHRFGGLLTVQRGRVVKKITVEEGRLVFATSSDPDERLGNLLLRRGRLTLRQFLKASDRVAPGKRFGTILVEDGVFSPKDLVQAVTEQTREIIYGAFGWAEGHYQIEAGQREAEAITLKIDTPRLILEGIHRIDSWSRVERALGGAESVYRGREGYRAVADRLSLDPEYAALVESLARPCSVEQLCAGSKLPSIDVCRSLWAFRIIGLIEKATAPAPSDAIDDEGLAFVLPQ